MQPYHNSYTLIACIDLENSGSVQVDDVWIVHYEGMKIEQKRTADPDTDREAVRLFHCHRIACACRIASNQRCNTQKSPAACKTMLLPAPLPKHRDCYAWI